MRTLLLASVWVLSCAVLAGCPRPSSTPQCQFNSDCAQGQICRDNACVTGCESDRDCPTNLRCTNSVCEFSVGDAGPQRDAGPRDAGPRDAAGTSSSGGDGGGAGGEEDPCNANAPNCAAGLVCTAVGTGLGSVCLNTCNALGDGGVGMSNCAFGRQCFPTNGESGVCLRTAGRDEMCGDFFIGVDPLLLCEDNLTRLVDDPTNPTVCACKLLCTFSSCPGPNCECPTSDICVRGVLNSATQGACGQEIPAGDMCTNPFDYPFSTSFYCAVPAGVPQSVAPIPVCYYASFETFESTCQLLCGLPNDPTVYACPAGQLCLDADMDIWGPGVRTCQGLPGIPDGGLGIPDSGNPDAAGLDAAVLDAAVLDGAVDAGPALDAATPDAAGELDAAVTDAALTDAAGEPDAAGEQDAGTPDAAVEQDAGDPPDAAA